MEELETDILVLGSGGAGLMAALYALDTNPKLNVTLATKGLFGKSGCTRMVQGGYNVVLSPNDSTERHFQDTMLGGHWLNNHILARTLVEDAPVVVHEMWEKAGVRFARDKDGNLHQKGLAGQTFDRTVHHGDLTGIEIVSRLSEQVRARGTRILEECRAVDLLVEDGEVFGAVLLPARTGEFIAVRAKITVLATGGSAPIFSVSSASLEKCGDGYALAYRAGATLMDMEMSQFHPTGLVAPGSRFNGSVIAEELRAAGGHLYNSENERFMGKYNPRFEKATRDEVSRGCYFEIAAGRGTPNGGVWLDVSHLGAKAVEELFPGMLERCFLIGRDLRKEPIEVCPTSHFEMGGVRIDRDCHSDLPGLLVAGEDSGGVHGANRLGGNGVADSTVYGRRAGLRAANTALERRMKKVDPSRSISAALSPWERTGGEQPQALHAEFRDVMWTKVGVVRDATAMSEAIDALQALQQRIDHVSVTGSRAYNLTWQSALDVRNAVTVGQMVAQCALIRQESRGAHYRSDFSSEDPSWTKNLTVRLESGQMRFGEQEVVREPAAAR
ncbi:MAG TPA: FAD-binding protein [Candidatus Baltobacteraceae bacterium]|jgi:succinate dehydrogenase / fumarate reductase flavoprotein subunit/fumarate reductase flavoprotein subunit